MNTKNLKTFLIAVLAFGAASARAYTVPSEDRLDQVLANPGLIRVVLDDANGQDACELMSRILGRLESATIPTIQKEYLASYYAARITFLLADQSVPFVTCLLPKIAMSPLRVATLSGISVGGRGSASLMSHLRNLLANEPVLLQAINAPQVTLGEIVYKQLLDSLRGVQSLPPVTDSLAPPGDGTGSGGTGGQTPPPPGSGGGGGPPPPVPEPYQGQQNP